MISVMADDGFYRANLPTTPLIAAKNASLSISSAFRKGIASSRFCCAIAESGASQRSVSKTALRFTVGNSTRARRRSGGQKIEREAMKSDG
jgi:hypothetical protein